MTRIQINVQGHTKPLYCDTGVSSCGSVKDGLSFQFGDEGCWVISLEELRQLVQDELDRRSEAAGTEERT